MSAELDALQEGSTYFNEQLAVELFRQRIRRNVRQMLEQEDFEKASQPTELKPTRPYAPLPAATPELIPGLLPESGTAAIVGETDTGKSLLALEIASSLLNGTPLWDVIEPARKVPKVVYVLGEHTCETLQGLYHRTGLPHSGDFVLIGPEHLHPHKALVIAGVQQPIAVDRLLKFTEGAGLIVFDPLAGFVQGLTTENDNTTMRTLIDTMSLIATKQGASCLILSHMGKPKLDEHGSELRRNTYATRGATAIEDALTHIFYLKKVDSQRDDVELYDLSVRKFKGNPSQERFRLARDPETKRNRLTGARGPKASYPSLEERIALAAKVQRVREANPAFTMATAVRVVADAEGLPQETLRRWLVDAPTI